MTIMKKTAALTMSAMSKPFVYSNFVLSIACAGLLLNASATQAMPRLNVLNNWKYLSDGYDPVTGKPNNMTDTSTTMPADLEALVQSLLPEGQSITGNTKALAMLNNEAGSAIKLKGSAKVTVSYVAANAMFQNSLGYFTFPETELTTLSVSNIVDTILFPYLTSGSLKFGDTVNLGSFNAGDAIGFTLVSNGWMSYDATTTPASGGIVDPNRPATAIFRNITRLNPETDTSKKGHALILAYPDKELMILAFEDLNRENAAANVITIDGNDYTVGSDEDFNDMIVAVHISPWSSVNCTDCNYIVPPTAAASPTSYAIGEEGEISWRELNTVGDVADPMKAARAAAKAAAGTTGQ